MISTGQLDVAAKASVFTPLSVSHRVFCLRPDVRVLLSADGTEQRIERITN
jgi:hypothetical protein